MPALNDPIRLQAYQDALSNWAFTDFIEFSVPDEAHRYLRRDLQMTTDELCRLMYEHVRAGGEIDEVTETRPEWTDYEFHYDLRIPIRGRMVYIETRLDFPNRRPLPSDESSILVVNIHDC